MTYGVNNSGESLRLTKSIMPNFKLPFHVLCDLHVLPGV